MLVAVGKVRSIHGLKGYLKAEAFSGNERTIKAQDELFLGASAALCRPYRLECLKGAKAGTVLVKLAGIDNPESAEGLRGHLIFVQEERLPQLPEGSFYSFMLEGLDAFSTDGIRLGEVAAVEHYPANDVLAVRCDGGEMIFVPAVKDLVKMVDLKARKVIIEDRKGLRQCR